MNIDIRFYLSLLARRSPVMMALILICSGFGVVTAYNLPSTYSSNARLLFEASQIPEGMAASVVQTSATEQLSIVENKLLTRANLIDIANKFEVFEDMRSMDPDEVFSGMRQAIRISRRANRGEALIMTISFRARNGRIAGAVVNELVTKVLEENTDFRISRAEGALAFFEQEVERLAANLNIQSGKIVSFKSENESALPENLDYRLGRQALLQERMSRLENERAGVLAQQEEIVRVFEATGAVQQTERQVELTPQEQQLAALQTQLLNLQTVYSDSNPRVQLLVRQITQLESTIAAQRAIQQSESSLEEVAQPSLLELTMAELDSRLERAENEIVSVSAELEEIEGSIRATASNGIALSALLRDYENIQREYNAAVRNLNEARVSERIEVTSQGQRVTVIEGANVPNAPSGPNRPRIAAMGIGAGFGLAAAFFVLLEMLNFNIRRPSELESRYGVRPIAAIPYIESSGQRMMRRGMLLVGILIALVGAPAVLWYIDSNVMPLENVAARLIDRFGL